MNAFVILLTAVLAGLIFLVLWAARRRQAALLASVEMVTLPDFASAHLDNQREITVFLPPGYHTSGGQRYPTLYVNDGQDVVALKLQETVANLIAQKQIPPIIVVAIPTNDNRLHEYGTAVSANAQKLGTQAAAYTRFVVEELLPAINQQFRTTADPATTAFLGASLGGLSAFDIAWQYPDKIGLVGVMSGSFWWRAAEDETAVPANQLIAHSLVRQTAVKPRLRFWFEAATLDETSDRDNNGVIDAIQDTLELIDELVAVGFVPGTDVIYLEVAGGRHHYDTWAKVFPLFLRWAFGAR